MGKVVLSQEIVDGRLNVKAVVGDMDLIDSETRTSLYQLCCKRVVEYLVKRVIGDALDSRSVVVFQHIVSDVYVVESVGGANMTNQSISARLQIPYSLFETDRVEVVTDGQFHGPFVNTALIKQAGEVVCEFLSEWNGEHHAQIGVAFGEERLGEAEQPYVAIDIPVAFVNGTSRDNAGDLLDEFRLP